MTLSRRESLRQQRLRRRRIFYICSAAFFIIVAILIGILIARIADRNAAPVSDQITEVTEEEGSEVALPPSGTESTLIEGDILNSLTEGVRQVAIENSIPVVVPPTGYELQFMTEEDLHKGNLVLVNKEYKYEFWDFADTTELVSVYDIMTGGYDVASTEVMLQPFAADALDNMLSDFYDNTWRDDLLILCGYRTMEESQELYDASAIENVKDHADRYVMKPGHSEHHSALVADLGIMGWDGSVDYFNESDSWLSSNCHKYGFIVRYPAEKADITGIDSEPWHFRYVGVPNATAMMTEGLCMEEYMDFIKSYTAGGLHYQVTTADGIFDIYYAEGVQVPVPQMQSYEISGNNVDGFIVTVKVG